MLANRERPGDHAQNGLASRDQSGSLAEMLWGERFFIASMRQALAGYSPLAPVVNSSINAFVCRMFPRPDAPNTMDSIFG